MRYDWVCKQLDLFAASDKWILFKTVFWLEFTYLLLFNYFFYLVNWIVFTKITILTIKINALGYSNIFEFDFN